MRDYGTTNLGCLYVAGIFCMCSGLLGSGLLGSGLLGSDWLGSGLLGSDWLAQRVMRRMVGAGSN